MEIEHNTKNEAIEKVLIEPLVFLDLFSYPLTAYEVWYFLDRKFSLLSVIQSLDGLVAINIIEKRLGFYFLIGKEENINIRQARYNYSCKKIKIARRFSFIFSFFPGVKAVAVANFIGSHNLRAESDIDFFIITARNQLWLSRLFCTGFAKIMRSRPTNKKKKNKICLSFYISEEVLSLAELELSGGDPYFYYWKRGLLPIFSRLGVWENFLKKNNLFTFYTKKESIVVEKKNFLTYFERTARSLQLFIMAPALKQAMQQSTGVVVSDSILKFYLQDRRDIFREKFNLKMHEISQKIN